jgi:hypothetical protein
MAFVNREKGGALDVGGLRRSARLAGAETGATRRSSRLQGIPARALPARGRRHPVPPPTGAPDATAVAMAAVPTAAAVATAGAPATAVPILVNTNRRLTRAMAREMGATIPTPDAAALSSHRRALKRTREAARPGPRANSPLGDDDFDVRGNTPGSGGGGSDDDGSGDDDEDVNGWLAREMEYRVLMVSKTSDVDANKSIVFPAGQFEIETGAPLREKNFTSKAEEQRPPLPAEQQDLVDNIRRGKRRKDMTGDEMEEYTEALAEVTEQYMDKYEDGLEQLARQVMTSVDEDDDAPANEYLDAVKEVLEEQRDPVETEDSIDIAIRSNYGDSEWFASVWATYNGDIKEIEGTALFSHYSDEVMAAIWEKLYESMQRNAGDEVPHQNFATSMLGLSMLYSTKLVDMLVEEIFDHRDQMPAVKAGIQVRVTLLHPSIRTVVRHTTVGPSVVWNNGNVRAMIEGLLAGVASVLAENDLGRSGYVVVRVDEVQIDMAKHIPFQVSGWFDLPYGLKKKKCVINIHNEDNRCGQYAFALGAILGRGEERPGSYRRPYCYAEELSKYDWSGIEFPMTANMWDIFELKNPEVAVFVYEPVMSKDDITCESIQMNRLPRTANRKSGKVLVYLLLVTKEVVRADGSVESFQHYVTISNLSRLFNSNDHKTQNRLTCPYCLRCLKNEVYSEHIVDCVEVCETECVYPPEGSKMRFMNYEHSFEMPVYMTCDTEAYMQVVEQQPTEVDEGDGKTVYKKHHVLASYALYVHNKYEHLRPIDCPPRMKSGGTPTELVQDLMSTVKEYSERIRQYFLVMKKTMSHISYRMPHDVEPCVVCKRKLGDKPPAYENVRYRVSRKKKKEPEEEEEEEEQSGEESEEENDQPWEELIDNPYRPSTNYGANIKAERVPSWAEQKPVAAVDVVSGDLLGFAHTSCNQRRDRKCASGKKIPLFFHNGTGYDFKSIIRELGDVNIGVDLSQMFMIARSSESIKRLDLAGVSMVDSLNHLPASLESLVEKVTDKGKHPGQCVSTVRELQKLYPSVPLDWIHKVTRKGLFPYAWFDTLDKFNDTELPPREAFKSDLDGGLPTEEEYAFAKSVWEAFGCKTFKHYHDLYLWLDVLLLSDVVNSYRQKSMETYGLDPLYYASVSSYAFDCMLKVTEVELELITDPNMFLMFEKSLRGGISMAGHPYACAENKYTRFMNGDESMEERPEDNFLMYVDCNSLYASVMTEALPYGGFLWVDNPGSFNLSTMEQNPGIGYLLEVDLEVPVEYHDYLSDYPPAPENIKVTEDLMSAQQQRMQSADGGARVHKLVPHLMPKYRYALHSSVLETYMKVGVQVTKVHRVIQYLRKPFMKKFIDLNIEERQKAQRAGDTFGQSLKKAMSNHAYGKTMENVRKQAQFKLVSCKNEADDLHQRVRRMIASNNFVRAVPVGKKLYVCEIKKRVCLLEKPIYLGSCILDLSKRHMYNCWYQVLAPHFGMERMRMVYTDTDSFIVQFLNTTDLLREMRTLEMNRNYGLPVTVAGQGVFDMSSLNPALDPDYYSTVNQGQPFMFKIEHGSDILTEVTALRAKMYALKIYDRTKKYVKEYKKAKGVPSKCQSSLDFDKCLRTSTSQECSFVKIGSVHKQNLTMECRKKALPKGALTNDKKWLAFDAENHYFISYALGHYKTY